MANKTNNQIHNPKQKAVRLLAHHAMILPVGGGLILKEAKIMSAYIVEDETINRVVGYLRICGEDKKLWIPFPLKQIGYDLANPLHCKRLSEEMFTLNCDSIEQHYGEGSAEDMSGGHAFVHQVEFDGSSRTQVLKSLACFLYQACEGNCEKSLLYQALARIKGILAYDILSDMSLYENAKWA